jgi:hypothetical protein
LFHIPVIIGTFFTAWYDDYLSIMRQTSFHILPLVSIPVNTFCMTLAAISKPVNPVASSMMRDSFSGDVGEGWEESVIDMLF